MKRKLLKKLGLCCLVLFFLSTMVLSISANDSSKQQRTVYGYTYEFYASMYNSHG